MTRRGAQDDKMKYQILKQKLTLESQNTIDRITKNNKKNKTKSLLFLN